MVEDKFDLQLEIDASQLLHELEEVDKERERVEHDATETIDFIKKESKQAFLDTIGMARVAWMTTRGVVRAVGGTISSYFNLLIHTAFRTVEILYPLFTAKAAAGDYASAAIGMVNLAIAVGAMAAAEKGQQELASRLHGATTALRSLGYLLGRGYNV